MGSEKPEADGATEVLWMGSAAPSTELRYPLLRRDLRLWTSKAGGSDAPRHIAEVHRGIGTPVTAYGLPNFSNMPENALLSGNR